MTQDDLVGQIESIQVEASTISSPALTRLSQIDVEVELAS